MATVTESEGSHTLSDGHKVYTKTYLASPERARLLFLHGFSDHSGNYTDLHPYLASRGISVHAFDQRGWGRSVSRKAERGLTGTTGKVMGDISSLLRSLVPSGAGGVPVFLMGHSMGGGEALFYTATDPDGLVPRLRGTVALAPLVRLHASTAPGAFTLVAGRLAAKLLPARQMVNKLRPELLSRDPVKNQEWVDDELNHDTGTLEGLAGMLDRGASLDAGGDVRLGKGAHEGGVSRLLICHGTADELNAVEGSRAFMEKCEAEDKSLWELDGWYHNLHVEPEKEMFREKLADWLLERSKIEEGEGQGQSKL